MFKVRHIPLIAAAALGSFAVSSAAQASQSHYPQQYRPAVTYQSPASAAQNQRYAQARISYAQAKSIAERRVPGAKVVDISLNGNTYRVRMERRDGRVVDVYVDAVTGRVR